MPTHQNTVKQAATQFNFTFSSFVVSGTNPGLIVRVATRQASGSVVTGVTWNTTENFTEVDNGEELNAYATMWKLASPTATTADIVVTQDEPGAAPKTVAAASLFTDTDQTDLVRASSVANANATSDTASVDITGSSGDLIIDVASNVSEGPDTIVSNTGDSINFEDVVTGGGTDVRGVGQQLAATGGADTMEYVWSASGRWGIVGAALMPAAAAAGNPWNYYAQQ